MKSRVYSSGHLGYTQNETSGGHVMILKQTIILFACKCGVKKNDQCDEWNVPFQSVCVHLLTDQFEK